MLIKIIYQLYLLIELLYYNTVLLILQFIFILPLAYTYFGKEMRRWNPRCIGSLRTKRHNWISTLSSSIHPSRRSGFPLAQYFAIHTSQNITLQRCHSTKSFKSVQSAGSEWMESAKLTLAQHIDLCGLEFFAYHGVYPEERKNGQKFIVDIRMHVSNSLAVKASLSDMLDSTVNYGDVYKVVRNVMEQSEPFALLESGCFRLQNEIYKKFPPILALTITIKKPDIDIGGPKQYVSVTQSTYRTNWIKFQQAHQESKEQMAITQPTTK